MKTFKIIDLAVQAALGFTAMLALFLHKGHAFLYLLLLIGAEHIVSSIFSLALNGRHYPFFRHHLYFLLSVGGYALLGVLALYTAAIMGWMFGLIVITICWYVFYTGLSLHEYRYWKEVDEQRNLLDLGN